jgi:hypothetical protein
LFCTARCHKGNTNCTNCDNANICDDDDDDDDDDNNDEVDDDEVDDDEEIDDNKEVDDDDLDHDESNNNNHNDHGDTTDGKISNNNVSTDIDNTTDNIANVNVARYPGQISINSTNNIVDQVPPATDALSGSGQQPLETPSFVDSSRGRLESSSTTSIFDESTPEYDSDRAERRKHTDILSPKGQVCNETIKLGDEILYYDAIATVGDPYRLCTGIVTGLSPDTNYIVQVNTGDVIHSNRPVKRLREMNSEGSLVAINERCRMRDSAHFRCVAGGSATAGITEQARHITEVFRHTNNELRRKGVSADDLRQTPRTMSNQLVGDQGFLNCNCKGKCDNKRCGCRKKGFYCTAHCHRGNTKCTNCDNANICDDDDDDDDNDAANNNNHNDLGDSGCDNIEGAEEEEHDDNKDGVYIDNDDNGDVIMHLDKEDKDEVDDLQQHATTNNTNNNNNFSHQSILDNNNNNNFCHQSILDNNNNNFSHQSILDNNNNNNNNSLSHQSILDLANQYVTSPSNHVEHKQNHLALKALASSNVTSLPPQVGMGQLQCPHVWIDNCPTKSGKALQLLKWRGMSQFQQEFLTGIALAFGGEPAEKL